MKIFQLKPLNPQHRAWRSLPLGSYCGEVIVRAVDERTARRACIVAFGGHKAMTLTADTMAPLEVVWSSPTLVACAVILDSEYRVDGLTEILQPAIEDDEIRAAVEQLKL